MNLLIVEDEKLLAGILQRLFDPISKTVTTVNTFRQALAEMKRKKFDVVTLDLNLPDTRDVGTLQRIKDLREQNPDVIVIVYTGMNSPELEAEAIKYGADGFISKATAENVRRGIIPAFHAVFQNLLKQPLRYQQSINLLERVVGKISSHYATT